MGSWEESFVDIQVEKAWLDLRAKVADRLAERSGLCIIDFETPGNDHLLVRSDGDGITIRANRSHYSPPSADAAALTVFQVLHLAWGVPHPSFLTSDFLGQSELPITEVPNVGEPILGKASSIEELRTWVLSSLGELTSEPVKTDCDNETVWRTPDGNSVWVVVPNRHSVELRSVLARGVSFRKAHELADKLTLRRVGLRFYLRQDTLVMSQVLPGNPYVGEQIVSTLGRFISTRDELGGWVADKVLAKRARLERDELLRLRARQAELESELAELRQNAEIPFGGEPDGSA